MGVGKTWQANSFHGREKGLLDRYTVKVLKSGQGNMGVGTILWPKPLQNRTGKELGLRRKMKRNATGGPSWQGGWKPVDLRSSRKGDKGDHKCGKGG